MELVLVTDAESGQCWRYRNRQSIRKVIHCQRQEELQRRQFAELVFELEAQRSTGPDINTEHHGTENHR